MRTYSRLAEALIVAAMFVEIWHEQNMKAALREWRLYREEKK